jgi:hypothetical protein
VPPKEAAPKGSNWKTYGMNFLVGTAATMVGASILKSIMGPPDSESGIGLVIGSSPSSGDQNPQPYSNPGPGPQYQQYQYGQYQNQRRSVDHGKRADFFGEPHSSHGL